MSTPREVITPSMGNTFNCLKGIPPNELSGPMREFVQVMNCIEEMGACTQQPCSCTYSTGIEMEEDDIHMVKDAWKAVQLV